VASLLVADEEKVHTTKCDPTRFASAMWLSGGLDACRKVGRSTSLAASPGRPSSAAS